jgi:hypothetical protein
MKTISRFVVFLISMQFSRTDALLAQWVQTNGPYGGDISCFAVSGTNVFTGVYAAGVFLSTNNGTSWTAVNTGLTNTTVQTIAVSGTSLFAGTQGGGVFRSTNNGSSWTPVNSGLTNTDVRSFTISGTNLFGGTNFGGVFLSTNNATSWTASFSLPRYEIANKENDK